MIKLNYYLKDLSSQEIKVLKENIWFERDEIKKDSEYYKVIKLMIDKFLNNSLNKETFKVNALSKEINNIIQKSNFSAYYNNMYDISKKLDLLY